jgi:hypothetical protein
VTLPVPLAVRIGNEHVTREVQAVSFRKEAVGGVRSISFSLSRSLADIGEVDVLAKVYVYDGRSGATVAEGRLADTGRSAGPDGQRWDCVAFGPVQHASDVTRPLVYIDTDRAHLRTYVLTSAAARAEDGPAPSDNYPGVLLAFGDGASVAANSHAAMVYEAIQNAGMKLARINYSWAAGMTDATWRIRLRTYGASSEVPRDDAANTAGGGTSPRVMVTDWPNDRNAFSFILEWTGVPATVGGDSKWAHVRDFVVLSMMVDKSGNEITTGYTGDAVIASQVVADLLGRCLPEFDGPNATVTATTTGIGQLAYVDGVTPAQVLEDMMRIEPAYRWYTTPTTGTSERYGFRWELWPTSVRYEATLDDGGSFPLSAQDLYNQVSVRWRDPNGLTRSTLRTMACALLDSKSLTRRAQIDLGGELGVEALAIAAGDTFLAEHNVPRNSGTLTVARPIRDLATGAFIQPWEIEAGELVRVRGVEAYPDAFNADTNDGQGVFRIHAVDYTTEGNMATLALDSDPRETEDALVKLMNRRERR